MNSSPNEEYSHFSILDTDRQSDLHKLWTIDPESLYQMHETHVTAKRYLSTSDIDDFTDCIRPPANAAAAILTENPTDEEIVQIRSILGLTAQRAANLIEERADSRTRGRFAREILIASTVQMVLLIGVGFAAYAIFRLTGHRLTGASLTDLSYFIIALGSGAAGAATSVTLRLNNVEQLSRESTSFSAAFYRVALGVLFALALLLLLKSGLVDIFRIPSSQNADASLANAGYFWAAVGVVAGFNERWVGTLLTQSADPPARVSPPPAGHP